MVGASGSGLYHAFVWNPTEPNGTTGTMTDLGTLGGTLSEAYGINDNGQVVGWSLTSNGSGRAFLDSNGTMTDLGTVDGIASTATAVNANGQIAGNDCTTKTPLTAPPPRRASSTQIGRWRTSARSPAVRAVLHAA